MANKKISALTTGTPDALDWIPYVDIAGNETKKATKNDLVGPQGSQGFQGPVGPQGTQGFQGSQGSQGANGTQGTQGYQGVVGPQGTQGFQGITGPQGTQGFQGNQGGIGSQGTQGYQGPQGQVGPQGTQGFQGLLGSQGSQGSQGFQGIQGGLGSGSQGAQGSQGSQGFQGPQGPQFGSQGPQGFQGITGPQGVQGFQGTQGTTGPQGSLNILQLLSSDHTITGIYVTDFSAQQAMYFGDVGYINSLGGINFGNAVSANSASCFVLCGQETIGASGTGNWLLQGFARDDSWNWTVGQPIYLATGGNSSATMTQTQPTATDAVIQILGMAINADGMWFNPDNIFIEHI